MISILMPIYNGIEFVNESVESVLNQSYDKWELIIGINGHPENSNVYQIAKEYEKKYDKIHVFDFFQIKGKSNTLNSIGAEPSSGTNESVSFPGPGTLKSVALY